MNIKTIDHPEANGRKPLKGEQAYTLSFTNEDGNPVTVEMGKSGFETTTNLLMDMLSRADPHDDGSTTTHPYWKLKAMCESLTLRNQLLESEIEREHVASWKKIQAVLPSPANDDDRSLCQRVIDALLAPPPKPTQGAELLLMAKKIADEFLDPGAYQEPVFVQEREQIVGLIMQHFASLANPAQAGRTDTEREWAERAAVETIDLINRALFKHAETANVQAVSIGYNYIPSISAIILNLRDVSPFTPQEKKP